jgi:hypothetical protein
MATLSASHLVRDPIIGTYIRFQFKGTIANRHDEGYPRETDLAMAGPFRANSTFPITAGSMSRTFRASRAAAYGLFCEVLSDFGVANSSPVTSGEADVKSMRFFKGPPSSKRALFSKFFRKSASLCARLNTSTRRNSLQLIAVLFTAPSYRRRSLGDILNEVGRGHYQ